MRRKIEKINFDCFPPAGTLLHFKGQRYRYIRAEEHIRMDGNPTWLLCWMSRCAECGETFITKTALKSKGINRRCPRHHKPLVPVSGMKKARGKRKQEREVVHA